MITFFSLAEIVDAFGGWGYAISPEQVARPTSDFVLGVYSACLEQVTGITLDTLQEAAEQSLASNENPVRRSTSQGPSQCVLMPRIRICTLRHSCTTCSSTMCMSSDAFSSRLIDLDEASALRGQQRSKTSA